MPNASTHGAGTSGVEKAECGNTQYRNVRSLTTVAAVLLQYCCLLDSFTFNHGAPKLQHEHSKLYMLPTDIIAFVARNSYIVDLSLDLK